MTTHTIRRVGIASVAKVLALLYAALGFIAGAILTIASLAGAALGQMAGGEEGAAAALIGMLFGVGAIIILPIFYGVFGAVFGMVAAVVYNVVAGVVGGLQIDLDTGGMAPSEITQGAVSGL